MNNFQYQNAMGTQYQSAAQGNGFAQMPQQQQQLPVACNQVMFPFIQMNYGSPLFVPANIQASPNLQQYVPLIVERAMNVLQQEASVQPPSPLRVFLFNYMAANGFQNPMFVDFAQNCVKLVDMYLTTGRLGNKDVRAVIEEAVSEFARFTAATTIHRFPAITQYLPPMAIPACENIIAQFNQMLNSIERSVAQPGYPQQPMHPAFGQPIGAVSNQAFGAPINSVYNPSVSAFTGGFGEMPKSKYDSYTFGAPEITKPLNEEPVFNPKAASDVFDFKPADDVFSSMTKEPAVAEVTVSDAVKAIPAGTVLPAFNPNVSEIKMVIEKGKTTPIIVRKKEPMDREKHLAVPIIANTWGLNVISNESNVSVVEAKNQLPLSISDVKIVVPYETAVPVFCNEENWATLKATMLDEICKSQKIEEPSEAKPKRATLVKTVDVVVEPVIVPDSVIEENLAIINRWNTDVGVANLLNDLKSKATEENNQLTLNALRLIDRRLTASVNHFVVKEMALSSGRITSFMEDILELDQYLSATYGSSVSSAFNNSKSRIIKRALATGSDGFVEDFKTNSYDFLDEDSPVRVVPFTTGIVNGLISLSSVELQIDFATEKGVYGLIENDFPLLYGIASELLTSPGISGVNINHYYLRSSDDVVYEFTRGAVNKEFIFISKAS